MQIILQNLGTVAVCFILAVVIAVIVFGIYRDKRAGKSSCGGSCGACPMRDTCHTPHENEK